MTDIVCLGQFTADVVVRTVAALPGKGKATFVDRISLHNGGCACNTAVALGKLGVRTAAIGKLGRDPFGDFLMDVLAGAGVETSAMVRDPATRTSSTAALVHSDGERSFLHDQGGNAALTEDDIDYDAIADAQLLHVAAAFAVEGLDGEPMARILARAQDLGVTTCLDTAWDADGRWMNLLEPCLSHLDLFVPSIDEARMLTGETDPPRIADTLRAYGIQTLVIKQGAQGCYARTADREFTVPAFKVDQVVDTLGAGDAFVAGLLTGLVRGWDLRKACRLGHAAGACCVTAPGASGIQSMKETLARFPIEAASP